MNKNRSIVAIYSTHTAAEAAIKELPPSGFDMKKLSIVGCDYNVGDRMKVWGKTGAFWGGIWSIAEVFAPFSEG